MHFQNRGQRLQIHNLWYNQFRHKLVEIGFQLLQLCPGNIAGPTGVKLWGRKGTGYILSIYRWPLLWFRDRGTVGWGGAWGGKLPDQLTSLRKLGWCGTWCGGSNSLHLLDFKSPWDITGHGTNNTDRPGSGHTHQGDSGWVCGELKQDAEICGASTAYNGSSVWYWWVGSSASVLVKNIGAAVSKQAFFLAASQCYQKQNYDCNETMKAGQHVTCAMQQCHECATPNA